jgi:hypothetical protein
MQIMSTIRKDFVATHLRMQVNRLNNVLNNIEDLEKADSEYTCESLKEIEVNLRHIRKLCLDN